MPRKPCWRNPVNGTWTTNQEQRVKNPLVNLFISHARESAYREFVQDDTDPLREWKQLIREFLAYLELQIICEISFSDILSDPEFNRISQLIKIKKIPQAFFENFLKHELESNSILINSSVLREQAINTNNGFLRLNSSNNRCLDNVYKLNSDTPDWGYMASVSNEEPYPINKLTGERDEETMLIVDLNIKKILHDLIPEFH